MTASVSTSPAFTAPGPGGWRRLADHFPRALTTEYQRIYAETCPAGMAAYMERYGVLARGLDVAFVHGHLYITPVPLAGPREPRRTPPRRLVWLMARAHPTFRRRNKAAQRTLRDRPWRQVSAHWFAAERAGWTGRNGAVEAIDPSSLDGHRLAEHVVACRRLVVDGYVRHFELHGDDLLPVGLLISRCQGWGIDPVEAIGALAGASSAPHAADVSPWMLVTGYDLDCLTWGELGHAAPRAPATAESPVDLAPRVPAEQRDELRTLVDDARVAVRLRDDNGAITAAWPMGLLRRAMLEAGRRLYPGDPVLAVEATVDELVAGLSGDPSASPSTSAERLVDRRRERAANSALDAPLTLGPEFAIPPLDALPRALALVGAAQLSTAEHMATGEHPIGIGTASYTGRAIVVDDPSVAMATFEPGDVIVTTATSPSWNTLLVQAGALVTTNGGLTSHAAVTARELGLPAVIGDPTACRRLRTDDMVTVDPVRATVTAARR